MSYYGRDDYGRDQGYAATARRDYPPVPPRLESYENDPRPPRDRDYSAPPPAPEYGSRPAPAWNPPSHLPPLPSGWVPCWNDQYQRWYYAEESSRRTQWEFPGFEKRGDDRGFGAPSPGYGPGPTAGYSQPSYGGYQQQPPPEQPKKSGHGGMLMGAAGGLAAGAIGGVLLSHALDNRQEEHHYVSEQAPSYYPAPGGVPEYNYRGEEIDESDRESVEEARERYEEALDDARSSSASSSDREELEEAREEYADEYEEAYYDD